MSKYKAANGIQLTQGLFLEHGNQDAPYTLRDYDIEKNGKTYKSIAEIYRNSIDEYDAAMKIVESWAHWQKLLGLGWFVSGLETTQGYRFTGLVDWRLEMQMRDESRSKQQLQELAETGNVSASRYLNEMSRKGSTKAVGRPEKKPKQTKAGSQVTQLYSQFKK